MEIEYNVSDFQFIFHLPSKVLHFLRVLIFYEFFLVFPSLQ